MYPLTPEDVRLEMLRTIPGLENVTMMRSAYAIEYDCIVNTTKATMNLRKYQDYGAGQFNGNSGYEELQLKG